MFAKCKLLLITKINMTKKIIYNLRTSNLKELCLIKCILYASLKLEPIQSESFRKLITHQPQEN